MEEHHVRCTICGENRPTDRRIARGLIVFCCSECAPLVEAVHEGYDEDRTARSA